MKLGELQQALRNAEPASVLVSPRILERVIRQVCKLPTLLWNIPHRKCYVVDRHILFRHIEQDDLELEPDYLLPATVILFSRPPVEELSSLELEKVLLKYWRRLFHASVHLEMEKRWTEEKLTLADIRARIDKLGQAEFEEVRTVLMQDNYLPPQADERAVYIEFAAVYLELRHFSPSLLSVYFPGIRDHARTDLLLARDIDAPGLLTRTRLAGAPDPSPHTDTSSDESHEFYWRLVRGAERIAKTGNIVRAAIQRTRAARVAPADLAMSTHGAAKNDMIRLAERLKVALQLSDDLHEWIKDLLTLLDKSDQGNHPVEASLLFDLQKVCIDHEKDIYALDLVEWLLSGGKRPIKRPLPSQRLVRITRHLRSAAQRLTTARLSDADREHLEHLLESSLHASEELLRARFRPLLRDAFQDVGLTSSNLPESVAFDKMIEELLERISTQGFLTFGDLRDAISRNQLKMPDLGDPQDFIRGDPLLRLDRRLGVMLDGVYRPGEIYMRWLERLTALNFGTASGRWITRNLTIPFGGALVLVEGAWKLLEDAKVLDSSARPAQWIHWMSVFSFGLFFFCLMRDESLRQRSARFGKFCLRGLQHLFWDLPLSALPIEAIRRAWSSWPFQLLYWYLFKPAIACLLISLWRPETFNFYPPKIENYVSIVSTFLAAAFVLNSRVGMAFGEAVIQLFVQCYEAFRAGLLPGIYHWIIHVFKQGIDTLEYILFTVDDWLRFRGGDGQFALVTRTILGVFWFPVSYLSRLYMVVLIEPMVNPIKLPICILTAKFVYPLLLTWELYPHRDSMNPFFYLLTMFTLWLLPDAFGFLFWETKENWRLYRANRPATLRPVVIGSHGETMPRLLRPGVHSGTVPRLFFRLRRAERIAYKSGNWQAVRAYRQSLLEVKRAVEQFVRHELLALVEGASSWDGQRLRVGSVHLATNQVDIELQHSAFPDLSVWIEFEERAGWLLASIRDRGWLERIEPEQRRAWNSALGGFYKLASVDLVLEQVRAGLPAEVASFDISADGLLLWLDQRQGKSVTYDLGEANGQLLPRATEEVTDHLMLDPRRIIFSHTPLYWKDWTEIWLRDKEGGEHRGLFSTGNDLMLLGPDQGFSSTMNLPETQAAG